MNRTGFRLALIAMLTVGSPLMFPRLGLAGGAGETFEARVNGYRVSLSSTSELKTGENEVHVRIVDSQDRLVTPTKVEISVTPIEEEGHKAGESHGADMAPASAHAGSASGHDSMPGMSMDSAPSSGNGHDMESGSDGKSSMVTLQHAMESREHKGVLAFDRSGEWNLVVHFTVGGDLLQADIPVTVGGAMSRYGILAGIFGLNIAIVSTAALRKRNIAKKPAQRN